MTSIDEPVPPASMTEYTSQVLRDRILDGHYPLGARLDQRRLAEELGVSIIPVREGLRVLEASGLVKVIPNRGAFVTTAAPGELREIYRIRQVLDPLAAREAVPRMSEEALNRLAAILDETGRATVEENLVELNRLNREFHLSIYREAGMPTLLQMLTDLRDRYAVYSRLAIALPEYSNRSLADHREIYAACRAGEAERAGELVRRHIEVATEEMLERVPWSHEDPPAAGREGGDG
jgi:DNA-binding GntR family transcriptional regulator